MKINNDWFNKKEWVPYTIATCSAVVLYALISHLGVIGKGIDSIWHVIKPLVIGAIIAYLIDPIVRFYERTTFKKLRKKNRRAARNLAITLGIITVVAVIALILLAVIPSLARSIGTFFKGIKSGVSNLEQTVDDLDMRLGGTIDLSTLNDAISDMVASIAKFIPSNIDSIINTSTSVGSGVVTIFIGCIFAIYYLLDKEKLIRAGKNLIKLILKEQKFEAFEDFSFRANKILHRYISCTFIEAVVVGVANCIFMLIARMPYAALISLVVGITNMAPTFGPIVGAFIGSFILLLSKPVDVIGFLIFTIILQTIDGYVIKPKLFGETLGVSALLILVTIVVGGRIFGVIGILFAIPCAAMIDYLWKEYVNIKL